MIYGENKTKCFHGGESIFLLFNKSNIRTSSSSVSTTMDTKMPVKQNEVNIKGIRPACMYEAWDALGSYEEIAHWHAHAHGSEQQTAILWTLLNTQKYPHNLLEGESIQQIIGSYDKYWISPKHIYHFIRTSKISRIDNDGIINSFAWNNISHRSHGMCNAQNCHFSWLGSNNVLPHTEYAANKRKYSESVHYYQGLAYFLYLMSVYDRYTAYIAALMLWAHDGWLETYPFQCGIQFNCYSKPFTTHAIVVEANGELNKLRTHHIVYCGVLYVYSC